jgi:hypothetical protein
MKGKLHFKEKGPGRGWWGPPKGTHGAGSADGMPKQGKVRAHVRENAIELNKQFSGLDEETLSRGLATLQQDVNDAPLTINVPEEVIEGIVREGGVKNQYDTGTSGGIVTTRRKMAEASVFEVDLDAPNEDFPVYGHVNIHAIDGTVRERTRYAAISYGEVEIRLKNEVKARTTVSFDDSLRDLGSQTIAPAPASKVDLGMIPARSDVWWRYTGIMENASKGTSYRKNVSYIEAQIHGGVKLSDIDVVLFHVFPGEAAAQALDSAKVPWNTVKNYYGNQGIF